MFAKIRSKYSIGFFSTSSVHRVLVAHYQSQTDDSLMASHPKSHLIPQTICLSLIITTCTDTKTYLEGATPTRFGAKPLNRARKPSSWIICLEGMKNMIRTDGNQTKKWRGFATKFNTSQKAFPVHYLKHCRMPGLTLDAAASRCRPACEYVSWTFCAGIVFAPVAIVRTV